VHDGEIVVRKMTNLSITLDHRIVDGATAARFLNDLIRLLETPGLLLLEDR
jgi:pyruvate dehydrogenase E2 component (dihydrolipoamide acetyltransferase)